MPNSDDDPRFRRIDGLSGLDTFGWKVVARHPNPWGRVPMTAGGQSLDGGSREYMDRLLATQGQPDPKSRRHHYVPQAYLRRWSSDEKRRRVWCLDTITRQVRELSVKDVCVEENFYRVVGQDGTPHNRVEAMFAIVDAELARVQSLFEQLDDPDELQFDDLIGLGMTIAMQRMRTAQQRRLRLQYDAWLVAQSPQQFKSIDDPLNPLRISGVHTELLFTSMWEASDVMTTKSIEVWDDPEGRFWTCDAPVLVPFQKSKGPALLAAEHVLWPISPRRVVALTSNPSGKKAIIRSVTPKERGLVRTAIEQGRERWIFASADQVERLPRRQQFRRRTQIRLRCSSRGPDGQYIQPPGCCVEQREGFALGPDVALCQQGLHVDAPTMWDHS